MKLEFGTGSRFGRLNYKEAYALVEYALNKGINRFDTGFSYGNFKSQPLLAKCLEKKLKFSRESLIISTKCAAKSPEYINYCIQKSLETFKSSYIDNFHLWGANIQDLEDGEILKNLRKLQKEGKIKTISVNTHQLKTIKKISTGFYSEIKGMLIDFNLLKQDRIPYIKKSRDYGIQVFAGTVLCQGLLIESISEIFLRSLSPFYLGRALLKKESREYLKPAKILRKLIKNKYKNSYREIPLSYVINESLVEFIPIGMLSMKSIKRNVEIAKNPIKKEITDGIAKWAFENCQIKENYN